MMHKLCNHPTLLDPQYISNITVAFDRIRSEYEQVKSHGGSWIWRKFISFNSEDWTWRVSCSLTAWNALKMLACNFLYQKLFHILECHDASLLTCYKIVLAVHAVRSVTHRDWTNCHFWLKFWVLSKLRLFVKMNRILKKERFLYPLCFILWFWLKSLIDQKILNPFYSARNKAYSSMLNMEYYAEYSIIFWHESYLAWDCFHNICCIWFIIYAAYDMRGNMDLSLR